MLRMAEVIREKSDEAKFLIEVKVLEEKFFCCFFFLSLLQKEPQETELAPKRKKKTKKMGECEWAAK